MAKTLEEDWTEGPERQRVRILRLCGTLVGRRDELGKTETESPLVVRYFSWPEGQDSGSTLDFTAGL
eukprot:5279240-Amphidinium_carterae.1